MLIIKSLGLFLRNFFREINNKNLTSLNLITIQIVIFFLKLIHFTYKLTYILITYDECYNLVAKFAFLTKIK